VAEAVVEEDGSSRVGRQRHVARAARPLQLCLWSELGRAHLDSDMDGDDDREVVGRRKRRA